MRHLHEEGIYRAILADFERRNSVLCKEKSWSRLTMALTPFSSQILIKKRQFAIKIDDHAQLWQGA